MKHSLIRFSAVVLTIAFVFALTGCGSGSNSFTWFVDSIPANLDPQVASASADVIACENLYSGLVRKDPSGKYEPALCERWEKSSDGLTYTFYLKDGQIGGRFVPQAGIPQDQSFLIPLMHSSAKPAVSIRGIPVDNGGAAFFGQDTKGISQRIQFRKRKNCPLSGRTPSALGRRCLTCISRSCRASRSVIFSGLAPSSRIQSARARKPI